jgi:hypothetical protein
MLGIPASIFPGLAQNVVDEAGPSRVLPATEVSAAQAEAVLESVPKLGGASTEPQTRRLMQILETQVTLLIEGWPWMPLHHPLGISGAEVYFDHPDELFLALSLALPYLSEPLALKTQTLLKNCLNQTPPYGLEGFERRAGRVRESYDVPASLRLAGRGQPHGALGVYAFWAWVHYGRRTDLAREHWPAVKSRMMPLLGQGMAFDVNGVTRGDDAAEKLNADIAGLIGCARLARLAGDEDTRRTALDRLAALLESRVNLERTNPKILEKTNSSTKHLHVVKLARYCSMVPELGNILTKLDDGCSRERLRAFREARPGWFMAYAERLTGGENYTNPLHLRRALFSGCASVEQLPGSILAGWLDGPHGRADLYFIEQVALTLWSLAGRR